MNAAGWKRPQISLESRERERRVMDIFVARQPIFDQQQKVFAYELLFRSGLANVFTHADPNQATSTVMSNSFIMMGVDTVTGGKKAFLNLTEDLLVDEYVTLLPKDVTVVEILETVDPTPAVIGAIKTLSKERKASLMGSFPVFADPIKASQWLPALKGKNESVPITEFFNSSECPNSIAF